MLYYRSLPVPLTQVAGRKQHQTSEQQALKNSGTRKHAGETVFAEDSIEKSLEALTVTLGQLVLVSPGENAVAIRSRGLSKPYLVKVGNSPAVLETFDRLNQIAKESYIRHSLGHPTHGHLTTIVHFNVFHGLARNAALLGLKNEWLIKGTTSPFSINGLDEKTTATLPCPDNMCPTYLQRSVPHHPWIDLFPLPRMRDNFLRTAQARAGTVDEDAMCRDIVDVGAGNGIEHAALVVWGNPWDPGAWEATEVFLRKWGWLLEGCTELLEGTNRWRRERGLRPFKFEVGA